MTTTTLAAYDAIARRLRAQLKAHEDTAAASLEHMHARSIAGVQPALDGFYRDLSAKYAELRTEDNPHASIPLSFLYENRRLAQIEKSVENHINTFAEFARWTIQEQQAKAVQLGLEAGQAHIAVLSGQTPPVHPALSVQVLIHQLNVSEAQTAARTESFGKQAASVVKATILTGIALGVAVTMLTHMVVRTLDGPRWWARAILRDQLYQNASDASIEVYRANSEVVVGWIWTCSLSHNSCAACIAMHGTKHALSESLEDHPCGGCQPVPYTTESGDIPSGADWFDGLDASVQQDILGPGKYALYANGKVTLRDLVGHADGAIYEKPLKSVKARR